jgi:hypothetical protein
MSFNIYRTAMQKQYDRMSKHELFYTNLDKDELYALYLESFPEGTNPDFREKTEHDCSCCRQFIKNTGNVVAIIDGKLETIWDVQVSDFYQVVSDAMSAYVKSSDITNIFRHTEKKLGTALNHELIDGKSKAWEHFFYELSDKFVLTGDSLGTFHSGSRADKEVLERSLKELSLESGEIVLDLILQNNLGRGDEYKRNVEAFIKTKKEFDKIESEKEQQLFLWVKSAELKGFGRFKNVVIGSLLEDLSNDVELTVAVLKFEEKVKPENFKRTTALYSQKQIDKCFAKVVELGLESALNRRYAVTEDLTINNVLFADRSARETMKAFDGLMPTKKEKLAVLDNVQEVGLKDFLSNVLPTATNLELMVENNHTNNFMSLIAPQETAPERLFKWFNNFSWSYNGEVTDSIKEKVKKAGGNVNGALRLSLSWFNLDDLDIHLIEPCGNHIHFGNKSGRLDVDMNVNTSNSSREAVENITYPDERSIKEGVYTAYIHNYTKRESVDVGFVVEMEHKGKVTTFTYENAVNGSNKVQVVKFRYSKSKGIEIIESLPSTETSKDVWGVNTCKWSKVSMVMNSPNHWDGEETGNKHLFFILDGCKNPSQSRGFYNEFLRTELVPERKVFEGLSAKMKCAESDNQLSGLGFSSTQRNSVLCKVNGSFSRVVKIVF